MRGDFINRHKPTHIQLIINHQKIVTGCENGDLIVWNIKENLESMQPNLILLPALNNRSGRLTAMTVVNKPLQYYTDETTVGIITIHQDNRIRIWDIYDGKCINISKSNLFPDSLEIAKITCMQNQHTRFIVAMTNNDNQLYVIDLWKLSIICKIKLTDHKIVNFKVDKQLMQIQILDSHNNYILCDIKEFNNEQFNNYRKYIQNIDNNKSILQKVKYNKISSTLLKNSVFNELPVDFFIFKQLFFVLYDQQLNIYNYQDIKDDFVSSCLNIKLSNARHFQRMYQVNIRDSYYLIIINQLGEIIALNFHEIEFLFKYQLMFDELNFSYNDFILLKQKDSHYCYLQMNALFLLKNTRSLQENQVNKYIKDFKFKISEFDSMTSTLIVYDILSETINLYDCEIELNKYIHQIQFLKIIPIETLKNDLYVQQKEMFGEEDEDMINIQSQNNILQLNRKSQIVQNNANKEQKSIRFQAFLSYKLKQIDQNNLKVYLNRVISQNFENKYKIIEYITNNSDDIEHETVLNSQTYFINLQPYHLLSTDKGQLIVLDFFFNLQKTTYNFYHLKLANSITFMKKFRQLLIIQDSNCRMLILNLERLNDPVELEDQLREDNIIKSGCSQCEYDEIDKIFNIQKSQSFQRSKTIQQVVNVSNTNYTLNQISLEDSVVLNHRFYDHISKLFPIKLLRTTDNKKDVNLAIMIQNNVYIYDQSSNEIVLQLNCLDEIKGIFLDCENNIYYVADSEGRLLVYSQDGHLERVLDFKSYQDILEIEQIQQNHVLNYENVHDYNEFKQIYKRSISKLHSILEYNHRYDLLELDYFFEKKPENLYKLQSEILGTPNLEDTTSKQLVNILYKYNYEIENTIQSQNRENGITILESRIENDDQINNNKHHIIMFDITQNNKYLSQIYDQLTKQCNTKCTNVVKQTGQELNNNLIDENKILNQAILKRKKSQSNSPKLKLAQTMIIGSDTKAESHRNSVKKVLSQDNLFSDPISPRYRNKKQPYFPYLPMIYAWNLCNKMNTLVEHLTMFTLPIFNMEVGIKGIADCFSFVIQKEFQWKASSYMVTYLAIGVFLYFINCNQKEKLSISQLINQSVQMFTKKKIKIEKNIPNFQLSFLAKQLLNENAEVMSAAVNLIAATIKNKEYDPKFLQIS